ncbi:MAG TPA: hypothetical protein VL860_03580 [Planctomycetota bacterium]|nr:hypothetical protein [Planctomycetota bacterium]
MSYPSGSPQQQQPAQTPPMVDILPVTAIPCRHCGSVCFRSRVERFGVALHTIGWYILFIGYIVLTVAAVGALVEPLLLLWTSYQPGPYTLLDLPLLFELLGLIVLGHILAMERQVWVCAACGSLFDRTERVEAIHADRQAKKQAQE